MKNFWLTPFPYFFEIWSWAEILNKNLKSLLNCVYYICSYLFRWYERFFCNPTTASGPPILSGRKNSDIISPLIGGDGRRPEGVVYKKSPVTSWHPLLKGVKYRIVIKFIVTALRTFYDIELIFCIKNILMLTALWTKS